jgi:hypothetical protein
VKSRLLSPRRKSPSPFLLFILPAALSFLAGCGSGPSSGTVNTLNRMIAAQNFKGAEAYITKHSDQYGYKNKVLYRLDLGAVQNFAGDYQDSNLSFQAADDRMEELYTQSLTKAAGMLVLNDTTVDYMGEPFERALGRVFHALNYVFLGQLEEALVESRNAEFFLSNLNDKMGGKNTYKDDAFVRYMDALFYADEGQSDDARISSEAADKAYQWYGGDYDTREPSFNLPDQMPQGAGELVFIHYNGLAPRKVSKTVQVAWGRAIILTQDNGQGDPDYNKFNALKAGIAGNAITVSYPQFAQTPYRIAASIVNAGDQSQPTQLAEDVSAIAIKSLKDRSAAIMGRAIARATIKFVIAKAAQNAATEACNKEFGSGSWQATACNVASGVLAQGAAAATEVADTRSWTTLPSQIRISRMRLQAGTYPVRVDFKDARGGLVFSHVFPDVKIENGRRTYLAWRTGT